MNTIELEKKMLDANKSNKQMAKALNISDSAWYRKKIGKTFFNAKEIKEIADLLHLDMNEVNCIFFSMILS